MRAQLFGITMHKGACLERDCVKQLLSNCKLAALSCTSATALGSNQQTTTTDDVG